MILLGKISKVLEKKVKLVIDENSLFVFFFVYIGLFYFIMIIGNLIDNVFEVVVD